MKKKYEKSESEKGKQKKGKREEMINDDKSETVFLFSFLFGHLNNLAKRQI